MRAARKIGREQGYPPVRARNYPESPYFVPWITLSKSS